MTKRYRVVELSAVERVWFVEAANEEEAENMILSENWWYYDQYGKRKRGTKPPDKETGEIVEMLVDEMDSTQGT